MMPDGVCDFRRPRGGFTVYIRPTAEKKRQRTPLPAKTGLPPRLIGSWRQISGRYVDKETGEERPDLSRKPHGYFHVDVCGNESWNGTRQVRTFVIAGNSITIMADIVNPMTGKPAVHRVTFERAND